MIEKLQNRRKSTQLANEIDIENKMESRIERKRSGSVRMATYKTLFNAVHSKTYIFIVFAVLAGGQFVKSGCDYFLSQW